MSNHTPGPWKSKQTAEVNGDHWLLQEGRRSVAILAGQRRYAENVSNAALIAASPELLYHLREVVGAIEQEGVTEALLDAARAAIAKAEGR